MTNAVQLWTNDKNVDLGDASRIVCAFLDTATTSFGRATHYNTRDEQSAAEMNVHRTLLALDRDIYATLLLLPGATDRSRQIGVRSLLTVPRNGVDSFLNPKLEREVLAYLLGNVPPQRLLKLYDSFRGVGDEFGAGKANNSRTRKLVLATLLGSKRLDLWAVKYRAKMIRVLRHVWGQRRTSIIFSVAQKDARRWVKKEREIMREHVFRFCAGNSEKYVRECVAFLGGKREGLTLPLFKAFVDARLDLDAGARLPTEVLEGVRSFYHTGIDPSVVLGMKAKSGTFTTHEKRVVQKRAKAAGIKVEMDASRYDPVELYISAFENGADGALLDALDEKAAQAALVLPVKYDKLGIVVDASASMAGNREQKLRPLAVTLALRDMLRKSAKEATVVYCGGEVADDGQLVKPMGETSLAEGLLACLRGEPDAVYVLSDGYENSPSGRFLDVLVAAREIGIDTPVFHLNPVFSAEGQEVKSLAKGIDGATTMPVQTPAALTTSMVRGLIEADPTKGINMVLRSALKGCSNERLALIGGEA